MPFCCVGETLNFSSGLILVEWGVEPKFSDDKVVMDVFGHVFKQFWGEGTREPHWLECRTGWPTCLSFLGKGNPRTSPWQVTMVPCDLGVAPLGSAVFGNDDVARVGRNVARVGWSVIDLCRGRDVSFWGLHLPE